MSTYLLAFLLSAATSQVIKPALLTEPKQVKVTPSLVCKVQHAIRFRNKAWDQEICDNLAEAYKKGEQRGICPKIAFSISINESDLREEAVSVSFKRTMLNKQHTKVVERTVLDVGLMGVRCIQEMDKRGIKRCINGPAKGLTLVQLFNPVINIETGLKILELKYKAHGDQWLTRYNGATDEGGKGKGYTRRIQAIISSLEGKQEKVTGHRMKVLTKKIISAVMTEEDLKSLGFVSPVRDQR